MEGAVNSKPDDLYVRAHILNTSLDLDLLIDTGAVISVIPSDFLTEVSLTLETIHVTGATGNGTFLTKTQPLTLFGPHVITTAVWVGKVTQSLLGMDVLMNLNSDLQFRDGKVTWQLRTLVSIDVQSHPIWANNKTDCGLLDMEPVKFTGTPPPSFYETI